MKHLDIKALIKSYSIQIDNLCQFLPQDRVVEFASLTSEQLLEQTQQAAAPDYMAQWHGDLKRLDKEKREKDHNQRLWKDQLGNDQTRQQHDQHTVDRMKERSELVEQLSAYKKFRLVVDYTEARAKCNEAKARSRAAEAEAKVVREELEPALQALNNKQGYRDKVDRVVTQKRKMVDRSELFADQTKKKHEALDTKISGFEAEEQAEKELITRTIGDERRTEGKIRNLKSQMEQAPPAFDAREYNETIREKNREMQELENQAGDVQSNMRDINQRAVDQKNIKTRANNDIDHFKSQVGQQMRLLAQLSGDSAKAWEWLQNNQDKFKEPVYGPPAVECSIADRAYATAVESVFRGNDFCIFTCTNRDDFATLSNYLTGKDHLNLSDVSIRSCTTPLQNFQKPVTNEQLALYGLDGWIIDYLKGPEAVLSMLCENMKLHKTGVTLKSHSNAQYEVLENSPITSWVAGQESITITRRQEYNAHSASVRKIRNGKVWSGQSVDMDGDREMRRQRDEASDAISALEEEMDKLKADLKTLQSRHRETKAEKVCFPFV